MGIIKLDCGGTLLSAGYLDIQNWLSNWPCSALHNCDSLIVQFENNGDLIDGHFPDALTSDELSGFVDYMKERYEYDAFITI